MLSKYRFYTGKEAHIMGALKYRNTQYGIWRFDKKYQAQTVVLNFRNDTTDVKPTKNGKSVLNLSDIKQYQPFKRLRVASHLYITPLITESTNELVVPLTNIYDSIYYINHKYMLLQLSLVFFEEMVGKNVIEKFSTVSSFESDIINPGESVKGKIIFILPEFQPGEYNLYFVAGTTGVYPATLKKPQKVVFE